MPTRKVKIAFEIYEIVRDISLSITDVFVFLLFYAFRLCYRFDHLLVGSPLMGTRAMPSSQDASSSDFDLATMRARYKFIMSRLRME